MGCVLKLDVRTGWALQSGRPLAMLHGCAKLGLEKTKGCTLWSGKVVF